MTHLQIFPRRLKDLQQPLEISKQNFDLFIVPDNFGWFLGRLKSVREVTQIENYHNFQFTLAAKNGTLDFGTAGSCF